MSAQFTIAPSPPDPMVLYLYTEMLKNEKSSYLLYRAYYSWRHDLGLFTYSDFFFNMPFGIYMLTIDRHLVWRFLRDRAILTPYQRLVMVIRKALRL